MLKLIDKDHVRKVVEITHKHAYKSRTTFEMIACGFVAAETHFVSFAFLLGIWFVVDFLDLLAKDAE